MSSYTPAQKAAYKKRMQAKRLADGSALTYKRYIPRSVRAPVRAKRALPRSKAPSRLSYSAYSAPESVGSLIGGWIGHGAQQLVKSVTGFGDYKVMRNSLMPGALEPPVIVNSQPAYGGVIVRHREYIQDIVGTQAFTLTTLPINVGQLVTFPWLSQIGDSFEQYCLHGVIFEFRTMSSDTILSSATNTALGTVIMATQYNSLDIPFADKRQMENYEFANSAKPSDSFIHPIECKKSESTLNCLYVRTGAVPVGADQRFYDMGQFSIATQGMQADGGVIGELWVTFEVELLKPKLIADTGLELLSDHWEFFAATASLPFGATRTQDANSTIASTLSSLSYAFPVTFSAGTYQLTYSVVGASGSATVHVPSITCVNCSQLLGWNNSTSTGAGNNATTAAILIYTTLVQINAVNATFTFANDGTMPASVTAGDLWVNQINGGLPDD